MERNLTSIKLLAVNANTEAAANFEAAVRGNAFNRMLQCISDNFVSLYASAKSEHISTC